MPIRVPVNLRRNVDKLLLLLKGVSVICVIVGIVSLLLLPLDEYSRGTYISENALLPGQVNTYFIDSEQNIVRAFREEVKALRNSSSAIVAETLGEIFRSGGLKTGKQRYSYKAAGEEYTGENVYAVLHAPRGDATEAVVLVAPFRNLDNILNEGGVALTLALARYFKRWSLWSKDIIFLISSDARVGPQAWVDAYHDLHGPNVESLTVQSGAIQGVIVVDYPETQYYFEKLHIVYDGVNGQLPNLDLINTAVEISYRQVPIILQKLWHHSGSYRHKLQTMLRGMVNQALGHSSGPHSSFLPYHIDAITLQTYGHGHHDEMQLGRIVESLFRSLNNLLEHFHQSFFFYLLMSPKRFVSIGTYLPSAMLLAAGFTLTAIRLWIDPAGKSPGAEPSIVVDVKGEKKEKQPVETESNETETKSTVAVEQHLLLPLSVVIGAHFLGLLPFTFFNMISYKYMLAGFYAVALLSLALPTVFSVAITTFTPSDRLTQSFHLSRCFSLLTLGMFLSALATLNFSLSFLVGLLALPLMFVASTPNNIPIATINSILLQLFSPFTAILVIGGYWGLSVQDILKEASFGWWVWGMWTPLVIWGVWWPAWIIARISVDASFVMVALGKGNNGK